MHTGRGELRSQPPNSRVALLPRLGEIGYPILFLDPWLAHGEGSRDCRCARVLEAGGKKREKIVEDCLVIILCSLFLL